jgi:type VII secretion integral membrane protein EccD
MNVRFVLRAAKLRVPQLPHTAEELQQDIEPEPEESVVRRTEVAVSYLNSLYITASLVFVVAFALLAHAPDWASRVLAADFAVAVLLRARSLTLAWQRVPLAACGTAGLMLLGGFPFVTAAPSARWLGILVFAVLTGVLLAVARRPTNRRMLPIWGHLADLLETWTAIAVLPLLLQLLHVYAHVRSMVG